MSVARFAMLPFLVACLVAATHQAHARGAVPRATVRPPGGNVGAWLGDGPIFGFDDGVCEPTMWSPTDDCAHKGECCIAPYAPAYGA
jgi:hypothetical protein